jgi:hypothetical protein
MAAELLDLVALDVLNAVDDAAAELQELWAVAHPAPPLERALADIPALGELALIEMFRAHAQLLQLVRKCAEHGISDVGFSGRPVWENPWEMRFSGELWAQAGRRQLRQSVTGDSLIYKASQ